MAFANVKALLRLKLVPVAEANVTLERSDKPVSAIFVPVAEVNPRRVVLKLVVVAEPKIRRLPEAETLPVESAKKRPFKFEVEVAIKIPSARRLEVVDPSVTVTAVVKALEPTPPVASEPQVNLPVVALYKTVCVSLLQSVKPVW